MSEAGTVVKAVGASKILTLLGPWGVLAGLVFEHGTDFVDGLFENAKNGVDPTPEEWAKLKAKSKKTFKEL